MEMKVTERMKLIDGSLIRTLKSLRIVTRVGETANEVLRSSISEIPDGQ